MFWIIEIFPGKFSASKFSELSILKNQGWEIFEKLLKELSHRKSQNVFENSDPRRSYEARNENLKLILLYDIVT